MKITRYEDVDNICKDMMKEIGSIGTGNAATALSSMLQTEVRMEVPKVELLGFTEAVDHVGEVVIRAVGVFVRLVALDDEEEAQNTDDGDGGGIIDGGYRARSRTDRLCARGNGY